MIPLRNSVSQPSPEGQPFILLSLYNNFGYLALFTHGTHAKRTSLWKKIIHKAHVCNVACLWLQGSWCRWMTSTSWEVVWWWRRRPTMSSTPPFLTQSPQIAYWPGRGSGWLTVWQKPEKNGPKPFPCITLVSMSALCTWIFIHEAQKLCCVLIEKAKSCSGLFIKLFSLP